VIFQIGVEWASARPPREPNLARSLVVIEALDEDDATLGAAQMVACRPQTVMVTLTVVLGVEPPPDFKPHPVPWPPPDCGRPVNRPMWRPR